MTQPGSPAADTSCVAVHVADLRRVAGHAAASGVMPLLLELLERQAERGLNPVVEAPRRRSVESEVLLLPEPLGDKAGEAPRQVIQLRRIIAPLPQLVQGRLDAD